MIKRIAEGLFWIVFVVGIASLFIWAAFEEGKRPIPYIQVCVETKWFEPHQSRTDYYTTTKDGETYKLDNVQLYGYIKPDQCYQAFIQGYDLKYIKLPQEGK